MQIVNKFNRGEIDDLLVTREEIPKIQDSASLIENFELLRFGAMRYRNGTEHLGDTTASSYFIPFLHAINDTADLEFTSTYFRPWVNDVSLNNPISTSVGAITDVSDATGTVTIAGNVITLNNGNNEDGVGRINVASAAGAYLELNIKYGPLRLLSDGVDTILNPGTHKIKFVGSQFKLESVAIYKSEVTITSVPIGLVSFPVSIPNPSSLRYAISTDIIYFAHSEGIFQVERRGKQSWSVVESRINDGVFSPINTTTVKLACSALIGDGVLTASSDYFTASSVGTLFKLGSVGQKVTQTTTGNDVGTSSIRLTGVGNSRKISYSVLVNQPTGVSIQSSSSTVGAVTTTTTITTYPNGSVTTRVETFEVVQQGNNQSTTTTTTVDNTGATISQSTANTTSPNLAQSTGFTENSTAGQDVKIRLQRSPDETSWEDVEVITGNRADTTTDDQDNSITFYRLYVGAADNGQGNTISMSLSTTAGSIEGICRVTSYTDPKNVNVQIVKPMGGTDATRDWYSSVWKEGNYPNVVTLFSSRLYYAGKDKVWGSLPDAFASFDQSLEGDSRAISKTVGFGLSDKPNWLSSTNRMVMGTASDEISLRSDTFGGVITQANMNIVGGGSLGSAPIDTDKIDNDILFVHRSLKKLIAVAHNYQSDSYDMDNFMSFNQQICEAGIKRIAVVREPETRVYCVLNNGEMRVLLYDKLENIRGWYRFVTNGLIKDVIATPNAGEDIVKIVVTRGSNTYYEKLSTTDSNNYVDSKGKDNLAYTAKYKSGKIGFIGKHSTLTERARIYKIGFIGKGHIRAIRYGYDFGDKLRKFGDRFEGKVESQDTNYVDHDHVKLDFNGKIETDSRVCLQATKACTIMAITYDVEESNRPQQKQQ